MTLKNKAITSKDEELNKVNRDFRSYKRVVDKEGRSTDTRVLLTEKKIEVNRAEAEKEE